MKGVIDFIKKYWAMFVKILSSRTWLFTFPAVGFAFTAVVAHSLSAAIFLALWFVTMAYNTNEE